MKLHLTGIAILALFVAWCAKPASGQPASGDPPPIDFNQVETPPKPLPKWIKAENGKQVFIDQGQFDPRLKGYYSPEGLKVEIVADFPTIVNPVGMTFGDDGTLYVLEWLPGGSNWNESSETFTYKDGSKRQVATMKKPIKDAVKILRDTKGTGVYDEARVIIEEELPSSILIHDGWLYVSGRGTVRRYLMEDVIAKRQAKMQVIAQGFCGFHHHQVSGLTIGNDGWLYITSGDDDNYVEGSDGSRATVLRTGAVFRCRPDGSQMHAYSMGYRNPYRDIAFDAVFNAFHADNDNEDGSKFMGCRLMHVAEESDFGWRLFVGARCCRPDPIRGAVYGELPGKLPPMKKTGRGAPAGLLIYNDTQFPVRYRGLLYYPDVYRKLIRAYRVAANGATFAIVSEFEFLKSDDPLFRPCQMVTGPDGAMYICDWRTNSGGAGQLAGDGQHGRIYRVSWAGTTDEPAISLRGSDSWAKIAKQAPADLLKTLGNPSFSDRLIAQRLLVRKGAAVRNDLLDLVEEPKNSQPARIAALGALVQLWNDEVRDSFLGLLFAGDPDIRRLAADGLALNCKIGDNNADGTLLQVLGDQGLAVRRAIVLALGRVGGPGASDALVNTFKANKETDAYLHDAILRAIERLGKPGIDKLVAMAQSGVAKDFDKVVEAFLTLRTRAAAEAIPDLLYYPHLTIAQRVNLIRSYSNYQLDPPISLAPVQKYLERNKDEPAQVKLAALEVLTMTGQPRNDKLDDIALPLLEQTDAGFRLGVIRVVENGRLAKAAPRLAQMLGEPDRPAEERTAVLKALRTLGDKTVVPALREMVAAATPANTALRLEALRTLSAIDGTAGQAAARQALEDKEAVIQSEAVIILGAQPQGAKLAGELFLAKKLPRELLPQVSAALRLHSERQPDLAQLLGAVMKGGLILSGDKTELARIEQLVRSKGNAQRGKALYLNARTLACINCHRLEGVGGSVGPDLSRIWDTHSIEKIISDIIDPSKEIKEGFQAFTATTKDGKLFTGLKIAQSADEVVLRDASARDIRIATKDLDELVPSKQSLMPDNAVVQLSFEQFLDLVAFLKSRPHQESLRGQALEFWVVGPFAGQADTAHPPEAKPDPTVRYPGAKNGDELSWQIRQVEPNGYLNLRSAFNRNQSTGYALTYVYSPRAQKAALLTGGSDALKIWLNRSVVHETTKRRPPRADEDRVDVNLKEGWNPILIRVYGYEAEHGLFLRFTDAADLKIAVRPEGK